MDWNDVTPHLTGLAHIATTGPDGPAVAVVAPMVEGDVVWVQTRRSSHKARNLVVDPQIAMMWQSGSETYLWGTVEVVDDVPTKERLWSLWPYEAAGFFGSPERPDVVLLRVDPTRATVMAAGPDGPSRLLWHA
jgi:general stress protein 26